ncbi:MAG: hypothetical protein OEV44_09935 [Spirochaetota bacterium]|nr:hypothetical protein [Spirochaetota bacterium]
MIDHLKTIFFTVRDYLLKNQLNKKTVGINENESEAKYFDFESEKIVINYLLKQFPKARILSGEVGIVNESLNSYDYIFVIDSVDGFKNFSVNIPMVGFSIAVIKSNIISTDTVEHALIGNTFSGSYFTASKGKGSFMKDSPIRQNPDVSFENAIITCNLNLLSPDQYILFSSISQTFANLRSFDCCSVELSYVTQGITAAHYDFRKRITAENFLAGALILKEMGGDLTDLYGNPISNIENLVEGYSFIASHNKKSHYKFLDVLRGSN